jgi:SNF2 family DNA or RNA helicase
MIILHVGADNGQLWLWAEIPADPPPTRPGRKSADATAAPYPFDAGPIHLARGFMEALPGRSIPGGAEKSPFLWLPTSKGRPIPSSGLIADVPATEPVSLAPYTVTALPLSLSLSVDLFCACVGRDTLIQGVLVGPTLAWYTRAMRFAGSLVARERFVPGLRHAKEGWRAVWQQVVAGPDGQRLARLVHAMPPACRAFSHDANAPPDRPPSEVFNSFLSRTTDFLVRSAIGGSADTPGRGGRVQVRNFSSIHDQWLFALANFDSLMHADESEFLQLAEQVRSWQRPIAVSSDAPFGLCFRLEEPNAEAPPNTPWHLSYLLQDRADPSLFVPVSDAWQPNGPVAKLFRARSFEPGEYLLTALGQAAGLFPGVEKSLKTEAPGGFDLDSAAAHDFLARTAWLLEQAGFSVLLPSWWTGRGTKARLSVRAEVQTPSLQAGGGLDLQALLRFDWKVAIGDQTLSYAELQALAKLKSPLVRVRGQWIQIRPEDVKAALALLQKRAGGEATLHEVVRMALGGGDAPGGLPFGGVTADGWVAEFLAQLEGKQSFNELDPPDDFVGTLRPYQVRGYSWLAFLRRWGLGGCLADDMGLGKTIQTLALIASEWKLDKRPSLLICPTSVVANWKKEAERFTPELPVMIHHGGQRAKGNTFLKQAQKNALVLSSYSLLFRDRELFEKVDWAGVILDEAQNVKNPQTKQAQAARAIKADFRIALTGTPVENHVGDLWSILEFLNPGWLGGQADFRKRFFLPIQARHDPEAAADLKRLTGPFILRRVKTDRSIIADLPEKLEMKVYCNLTREQATLYAAVVAELNRELESAEGIQRKGVILATLTRLKQVCNHPAHFLGDGSDIPGRSGKLARLSEMLEEVQETGEKTLVFTQYREMGDILKRHLQETFGREVLFLHGGVPREQRTRMVDRFQNEANGPRVFLLSLKAGGTGLNLTAATHVFHYDRWWNPAVENQATDRAYRIGQTACVQVHKFVCAGTVEEKIDDMIERKQAVASSVVSVGESWLTELDNDQLRDLFALRQDAIGE